MEQRTLGATGIKVSALGVGCWAIGGPFSVDGKGPSGWGQVDDAESERMIRLALERGVAFFDTAENYGWGHSEEILGRALGADRARVALASKIGHLQFRAANGAYPFYSRRHIREALAGSLRRLRTDHLDVYLFHRTPADLGRWDEAATTMEELRAEGKIRAWGISAYGPQAVASFPALDRLEVLEPNYNLLEREEEPTLAQARARHRGVIGRGSLAMGQLTGKFQERAPAGKDDIRAGMRCFQGEALARRRAYVERLRALLEPGETLAVLALRFVLSHPAIHVVLAGAKTAAQLAENLAAAERGPLPEARLAALRALTPEE